MRLALLFEADIRQSALKRQLRTGQAGPELIAQYVVTVSRTQPEALRNIVATWFSAYAQMNPITKRPGGSAGSRSLWQLPDVVCLINALRGIDPKMDVDQCVESLQHYIDDGYVGEEQSVVMSALINAYQNRENLAPLVPRLIAGDANWMGLYELLGGYTATQLTFNEVE